MGAECQEKQSTLVPSKSPSSVGSPNLKPLKTTAIPEISYSSSEDEDFFDAEDDDDEEEDDESQPVTAPEMKTPPPTSLDLASMGGAILEPDIQSPLTPVEGKTLSLVLIFTEAFLKPWTF